MQKVVSFHKLKLTNNISDKQGLVSEVSIKINSKLFNQMENLVGGDGKVNKNGIYKNLSFYGLEWLYETKLRPYGKLDRLRLYYWRVKWFLAF